MRWTGMPMAMWAVFARSFQTQLTAVLGYDAATAKQITKTAKPKYKEIIAKLPEFEKGDRFQLNIIGCAMLGAFVLCMPKRPDTEALTVYYENAQMTPLMKWFCRKSELGAKRGFGKRHVFGLAQNPLRTDFEGVPHQAVGGAQHASPPNSSVIRTACSRPSAVR